MLSNKFTKYWFGFMKKKDWRTSGCQQSNLLARVVTPSFWKFRMQRFLTFTVLSLSTVWQIHSCLALWHLRPCALGCRDAAMLGRLSQYMLDVLTFNLIWSYGFLLEGSVTKQMARKHHDQQAIVAMSQCSSCPYHLSLFLNLCMMFSD